MLAITPCQISLLLATGTPLIRLMLAIAPAQSHASCCPCQISLMLATALHPPHASHCPMRNLMLALPLVKLA